MITQAQDMRTIADALDFLLGYTPQDLQRMGSLALVTKTVHDERIARGKVDAEIKGMIEEVIALKIELDITKAALLKLEKKLN